MSIFGSRFVYVRLRLRRAYMIPDVLNHMDFQTSPMQSHARLKQRCRPCDCRLIEVAQHCSLLCTAACTAASTGLFISLATQLSVPSSQSPLQRPTSSLIMIDLQSTQLDVRASGLRSSRSPVRRSTPFPTFPGSQSSSSSSEPTGSSPC